MGLSGWLVERRFAVGDGRGWLLGVVLAVVMGVLLVGVGSARAEGLCSDSWVGGVSGSWGLASNWSAGHVPGASDVVCIGSGKTVAISEGANHAGVLRDEGSLSLTGGSLELSEVFEASSVVTLLIENATLTGAATLDVSHSLAWISGTMSGSGETVISAAGTASLLPEGGCESAHLTARRLVNDGTVTFGNDAYSTGGSLVMAEGARVENAGTFYDNSSASFCSPEYGSIIEGSTPAPLFVNTGTFSDTESRAGFGAEVNVPFENKGTFDAAVGYLGWGAAVPVTLASASTLEGKIYITQADVTAESMLGAGASVQLEGDGTLSIAKGATVSLNSLRFVQAFVTGAGNLNIVSFLEWEKDAEMSGSGQTTLEGGATAEIATHGAGFCEDVTLRERTFTNDGTVYLAAEAGLVGESTMLMADGARLDNNGVFNDNSGASFCPGEISIVEGAGKVSRIVNTGRIARQGYKGGFVADIGVYTENWGALEGVIGLLKPVGGGRGSYGCSEENPSFPKREIAEIGGVCTGTGDLSETQTDFSIGGHGSGLELRRSYNSTSAQEKQKSIFGYGWSASYSTEHLYYETVEEPEEPATHEVRIVQENGSSVEFMEGSGGTWKAPEGSPDILTGSSSTGFTLTLEDEFVYKFSGSTGDLESVTDENNNTTSFAYNGSGQIERVTDQSGESLTLAYNTEGLVKTVTDPMKHVVEYSYKEGDLVSVTQPGETSLRWQFKYEGNGQMIEIIDGRGEKTTYKYNEGHQVSSKTDPMSRTTSYEYGSTFTKVTNEATGAVTDEYLTSSGQPVEIIHGAGTAHASGEAFTYNTAGNKLTHTNGDGQVWRYEYNPAGDETLEEDPEGHKTKRGYNTKHQVTEETRPDGETTKYERDSHGNILAEEREAPEKQTQKVTYKYNEHGDLESKTNALKQTWSYKYDPAGERTEEVDPLSDKRTWKYNEDEQETSTVSPRGFEAGHKESTYTTTTERNARGLPTKITTPPKHETLVEYDGDNNVIKKTDPESNITKYEYDADNELTQTEEPNKTKKTTEYDGAGQVTKQTNGNEHATEYKRNVLEQVEEVTEPGARKTTKEYDGAGNLTAATDADKRTTKYKYDPDSRVTEVTYSDGKTPTVKYEYNGDGKRTKMVDGTGTTTYEYDQLDRLTATADGHGDKVKYAYNLDNQPTKITYPNGESITREYDHAERLTEVTDWKGNTTHFKYNANSDLTATVYPSATGNEDQYAYNETDAMTEVKMLKGTETLASIAYTRSKDELITKETTKGLPGEEAPAYTYDANTRLTKGRGIAYKYDADNNPTTIGTETLAYKENDEPEKRVNSKKETTATYGYNEVGQRVKTTPKTGPATTYEYNQAGDMTTVTRPKEGATPSIEDTYAYNGDGLRTAQTSESTTTYLAWELAESLPLLLNDATSNYIYGPNGLPIEQINVSTGTVLYVHHDQQGSTRLLTSGTGAKEASFTYDAYGNLLGSTGTGATALGYDGEYTNSETGLIYLRARVYDPATGQFMSVDPKVAETIAPYGYAKDDPLALGDPSGECAATVAAINGPHPPVATPEECEKKLSALHRLASKVKQRIKDLAKDEQELPEAEIQTHVDSLNQASRALEKAISAFKSRGCQETLNVQIPAEVVQLAEVRWQVELKPVA